LTGMITKLTWHRINLNSQNINSIPKYSAVEKVFFNRKAHKVIAKNAKIKH